MRQAPFEAAHGAEWAAFEAYLDAGERRKPGLAAAGFPPQELPERYRRICQCLAIASDRAYSPDLVDRLNRLALRGHHLLYQYRQSQSQRVADFFLASFPALVREEWKLVGVAALLLFGPLLGLIAVLQAFPEFVYYLLAPEQIAGFHQMYDPANRRLGMREADADVLMFGYYIWNNVRIGFQTFAGGMLAGVGSAWFLASNGIILGAVAGYLTQIGYQQTFWSFVAGHSALELMAIVFSGAAGLRLGMAIVAPGNRSRKAALIAAAKPAVRMMYGAAVMFAGAALVEAFWSPLTSVPFDAKIAVGIAGWALLAAYLLFAGRGHAAR